MDEPSFTYRVTPVSAAQQVRGEHVDREDMLQAVVGADAPRLPVTDPGIVNDRVVRAARVSLLGDLPHARDARQVADDDSAGRGQRRASSALAARQPIFAARCQMLRQQAGERALHVATVPLARHQLGGVVLVAGEKVQPALVAGEHQVGAGAGDLG